MSEMNPVIWISQLESRRGPQDVFFPFFIVFFYLLSGPLGLFGLLFRDASALTRRSEAARPQELFRSFCLDALSL